MMKNGEVESMKIWRELLGYVKLLVIVVALTLVINNVVLINAKTLHGKNTYGERPPFWLSACVWN